MNAMKVFDEIMAEANAMSDGLAHGSGYNKSKALYDMQVSLMKVFDPNKLGLDKVEEYLEACQNQTLLFTEPVYNDKLTQTSFYEYVENNKINENNKARKQI